MTGRIYDELLRITPLDPLQASLLVHISKLISFGESLTHQAIQIFTPLITNDHQKEQTVVYICSEKGELVAHRKVSNIWWQRLLRTGEPVIGIYKDYREYIFPIVDNGGKIIGGISLGLANVVNTVTTDRGFIIADTLQRLMLTATDEQIQEYEPISYLDGLIIFDQTGTILYGNDGALHVADLLGIDRRLEGTSIFSSSIKISALQHALQDRHNYTSEEVYHHMVLRQQIIPIPMGRNETRCILILHDCTRESKQQQELLVKNSMIKEIHHRVKNNLQTVAGLLRMEARRSTHPEVKASLQESISRIESMALVHDLVSHYDEDYIAVRSIFDELCRLLRISMVQRHQHVEFRYGGIDYIVSSHRASYISLIINELISNSLEHGLNGEDGTIELEITDKGDIVQLILRDSGSGFDPCFSVGESKRLGMQIINNLVTHELQGSMDTYNDNGAVVSIFINKE